MLGGAALTSRALVFVDEVEVRAETFDARRNRLEMGRDLEHGEAGRRIAKTLGHREGFFRLAAPVRGPKVPARQLPLLLFARALLGTLHKKSAKLRPEADTIGV